MHLVILLLLTLLDIVCMFCSTDDTARSLCHCTYGQSKLLTAMPETSLFALSCVTLLLELPAETVLQMNPLHSRSIGALPEG